MINLKQMFILTATAVGVAACGSGTQIAGISGTGISGTGFTSSGTITGFGSIFVNGVEFDTSGAQIVIEDVTSIQSALKLGMRVRVSGSVNADGITGTATSVKFEDQLEGPISSNPVENSDMDEKTFTVLGTTVVISADDTYYEDTSYAGITTSGINIEISGFIDELGVLNATRVQLKPAFMANATIVELKGTVANATATTFTIGSMTIDYASADVSDLPGGVAVNDQFVEVHGTLPSAASTTLNATRVELEDNGLGGNGNKISLEGDITDFNSIDDFKVDGQPVDASSPTLTLLPLNLVVMDGLHVEVEGTVVNNVLQAISLELREGDHKVHATVSNVDEADGTFDLVVVDGDPDSAISIMVTTTTIMEDLSGNQFSLTTALETQFVRVRGFDDGSGTNLIATRVKMRSPNDIIVQGVITGCDTTPCDGNSMAINVLGVAFPIEAMGAIADTEYQDINDDVLGLGAAGQTAFFGLPTLTVGQSLIKIKDEITVGGGDNAVGIADEVELQRQ